MRKFKWLRGLLLVVLPVLGCFAATAAYTWYFVMQDDHLPPEITLASPEMEISVKAAESELLQGVTAVDAADGDVTGSIVVEGISNITEDNTAVITYAAFDRSGNVAKASRTLRYTDYESPKIGLSRALVFPENVSSDVLSCVTAVDGLDGDISGQVKGNLVGQSMSLSYPGVHQVEFRVTNSLGDTEYLTLWVDVYEAGKYNAAVELSDYLIRLKTGDSFDPEKYVEALLVGSIVYPLNGRAEEEDARMPQLQVYFDEYTDPEANEDRNVRIVNVDTVSNVDTGTPGVYSVSYTVSMDEDYVGFTRLHVVVEE